MKALLVNTNYTPPMGKEYDASAYPADGLYVQGNHLFVRFTPPVPNSVPFVVMFTGAAALLSETFVGQRIDTGAQPFEVRGVSEDFVLKVVAIAQNPSLAQTLIK